MKQITTATERSKIKILIPFALTIIMLLVVSIVSINWAQDRNIKEEVKKCRDSVQTIFDESLAKDSRLMTGLIDFLVNDKQLQNAWLAKDRDLLLSYASPLFENIRSKYNVTHFYFHGLDKVCFLRVHEPSRYGDYIGRFTMDGAVREKKPVYGIELGPLGTFTLRVVYPWWIDGKLVGYIELGEEIEHIMPEIKKQLNAELVVTIDKSRLNRAEWVKGMKMFGRNGNWDLLSDFAIVTYTPKELPAKIRQNITPNHKKHKDLLLEIQMDGRNYRTGFVTLVDAGGHEVGDIIVMKDTTEKHASARRLSAILAAICTIVGIPLYSLFYFYINRIEHRLTTTNTKLKTEIKEREKTVEKLISANRELADFAHITAHDLKAPLRAIGSLAGIIVSRYSDKLDDKGKELLQTLLGRAKRINNQISSILRYSEIGKIEYIKKLTDFNITIAEVIKSLDIPANIDVTVENKLPVTVFEKMYVTQIFYCLLDNAVRHMDKPNGRIRINCVEKEDCWKFSVSDNGPGIEEKHFEKIFQIFQTLSRKDETEAIGIGLSIVKKIVETCGGRIWVISQVGLGTTFAFTLPKQPVDVKDEQSQTHTAV